MLKNTIVVLIGTLMISAAASADLNTGLLAYWPFDDCTATDASGNGLNGTINGDIQCASGIVDKSLKFNGNNTEVIVPDSSFFDGLQTMTVSAWLQTTAINKNMEIIQHGSSCPDGSATFKGSSFSIGINAKNQTNMNASGGLGNFTDPHNVIFAKKNLPSRSWHHLVWIFNKGTMTIYMDGIKDSAKTIFYDNGSSITQVVPTSLFSTLANSGENLIIGRLLSYCVGSTQDSNYYEGFLDEVRIWNRSLLGSEIQQLYANDSHLMGTVSGTGKFIVTCTNTTTNQTITLPTQTSANWDCSAAGLQLSPKQSYRISIDGIGD